MSENQEKTEPLGYIALICPECKRELGGGKDIEGMILWRDKHKETNPGHNPYLEPRLAKGEAEVETD